MTQVPLEAEEALLASCIIEPSQYRQAIETITPEHFQKPHNRHVWESLAKCYASAMDMDVMAICDSLDPKKVSSVGGRSYVISLLDLPIVAPLAPRYTGLLQDRFLSDKIQSLANRISVNPGASENANLLEEIKSIEQSRRAKSNVTEMPKALDEFNAQLDDMYLGKIKTHTLGFRKLDETIGGLNQGALFTIGAMTSHGKSSFLIQATMKFLKDGLRVLFLSCEMTKYDIFCRIMSLETGEALWRFRKNPSKELIEKAVGIQKDIANFHFGIFVEDKITLPGIAAMCDKFKPDVVVVDYIQSFRTTSANRAAHFSNVADDLKLLALQKNIIVLTASQFSRGISFRDDKTPTLADLKESGGIENASDVVVLVHIKSRDEALGKRYGEFRVEKNRNGQIRATPFVYDEQCARFIEMQ